MTDFRGKVSIGEKHVLYELVRLGLHPSIQYPVDRLHVDIAFPDKKLAFEIVGSSHRLEKQQIADSNRNYFLQMSGWKIYVFTENEAVNNPYNVAIKIKKVLEKYDEEHNFKSEIIKKLWKKTLKDVKYGVNITSKKYNCKICGKAIQHRGNCMGCNIRLKKNRER